MYPHSIIRLSSSHLPCHNCTHPSMLGPYPSLPQLHPPIHAGSITQPACRHATQHLIHRNHTQPVPLLYTLPPTPPHAYLHTHHVPLPSPATRMHTPSCAPLPRPMPSTSPTCMHTPPCTPAVLSSPTSPQACMHTHRVPMVPLPVRHQVIRPPARGGSRAVPQGWGRQRGGGGL